MKTIPLTQGKVAIVDDADYEKVNQYQWNAYLDRGKFYAKRNITLPDGAQRSQRMHSFIMGLEYGDPRQVDHKDRVNTLDNRRSNLRVTLDQNQRNVGLTKRNTSKFKGVHLASYQKKGKTYAYWRASIRVNYKLIDLGLFPTPELAAQAYDAAAKELHGEFACTNEMLAA
jgi:hypothetical protein